MNPHVRNQAKRVLSQSAGTTARTAIDIAIFVAQYEPLRRKAIQALRKLRDSTQQPKR